MKPSNTHKRFYQLLAIANQELSRTLAGWSEDSYRTVLKQYGAKEKAGRISATTMTLAQLDEALKHFKRLGFVPKNKKLTKKNWRLPRIAKLNAMWIALYERGAVDDKSEKAMQSWCKNNIKDLTALRWASSEQLNQAVEMLKLFQQRVSRSDR